MADHNDLVSEMSILEQMGTQERQKLAKKRRLQQLKKWSQREKEYIAKEKQINKRLANIINEENNGLNLKQYTSYNSNNRTKTKLGNNVISTMATNGINNNNNNNDIENINHHHHHYHQSNGQPEKTKSYFNHNNNHINSLDNTNSQLLLIENAKQLAPNGKVHFNVGVMLLEAAARNDYDEVKRLLMLGVSPDSVNHDGLTALHQCCIDASEPMMNLLLEFGAKVDARDTEQWTPLHAACTCGHLNLVKILVENGADLLAVNGDGNMPFDTCEDEPTLSYIESQMVERGITQEMIDITRASTEMQIISDLEKIISEYGDHVFNNSSSSNNATAVEHDINEFTIVNKKDNITLLHVAAANGYLSAVKFLLDHGANVNVCDNDLWTPLHGAACWGNEQHIKIVELLIEAGARLDAKTINDETVFDLCDNVELLERLNQIKDELESKQAAAIGADDRLRRTQSRTNSRVHSVRRTSVRDKNQISRREAREEAMLRVESNSSLDKELNGVLVNSNPSSSENSTANTSNDSNNQNSNNLEQTSRTTSNNRRHSNEVKQTDLDQPDDRISAESTNSRSQQSLKMKHESNGIIVERDKPGTDGNTQSSPSSTLKLGTQDNLITAHQSDSNINNRRPTSRVITQQSLSTTNLPTQDKTNSTCYNNINNIKNGLNNNATQVNSKQQTITMSNGGNINYTACDSTDNASSTVDTKQATPNVAFIAPINYTLSNLKKQRSDLRMRNSTIGGGLIANTTTIKTSNGISLSASTTTTRPEVLVDMHPRNDASNDIMGTNIQNGSISPSTTIRKFSGEPSESVGGNKRSRQISCCIVI